MHVAEYDRAMGRFRHFVGVLVAEWISMLAGVFALAVTIWLWITGRSAPTLAASLTVAFVAFFAAFYRAWAKEYDRRIAVEKERTPELVGTLRFFGAFSHGEFGGHGSVLAFVVDVLNHGADSIVDGFQVKTNSAQFVGNAVTFVPQDTACLPEKLSRCGYSGPGSDVPLEHYTGTVQRNTRVVGYLLARIGECTDEALRSCVCTIEFHDAQGNKSSARTTQPPNPGKAAIRESDKIQPASCRWIQKSHSDL
jgi:hypothetical protein